MIKVIVKTTVPAENVSTFITLAKPLVAASQAEAGNIFYNLHQSQTNPQELVFIESWKDQSAIDAHNQSVHFTTVLPQLASLCSTEMTIEKYDVIV